MCLWTILPGHGHMDIGQVSVWSTLLGHGHLDIGQVSQLPVCGQPSLDADIWTLVFYVRYLFKTLPGHGYSDIKS